MKTKPHRYIIVAAAILFAVCIPAFAADKPGKPDKPSVTVGAPAKVSNLKVESTKLPAAAILKGIAKLQEPSVIMNHTAEIPPATGGTETVFTWKGTRYTLWIWDWTGRDGTDKPTTWARIYYRPADSKGAEHLSILGDAGLKGTVADAFDSDMTKKKGASLPSIFTSLDGKGKSFAAEWSKGATQEQKAELQAKWDARYAAVLAQLAEFLDHAKKDAASKTASK